MRMLCYPYAEKHPFGEHGVLIALPASLMLWAIIITLLT